jgi:hypothetical protein
MASASASWRGADGCEYLFTLQFPDGTAEDAVARQMAVVETELRAVRDACQV